MKYDWLTAASFERADDVVAAINTLSIHAKLALFGTDERADGARLGRARADLLTFLGILEATVNDADTGGAPLVGADPRLGDLAARYRSARRRWPPPSPLFATSFADLRALIGSDRPEDRPALIDCLRGLRALVEQHAHEDVVGLLGDV